MPLSLHDYVARFGLEFVVIAVAVIGVTSNLGLINRTRLLETKDNSVVFSYLKSNPGFNSPLLNSRTTTILAQTDEWINRAQASPLSDITLALAEKKELSDSTTIQENVIVKTNPADTNSFLRSGSQVYEVVAGDTVAGIASSFYISQPTLMLENKLDENSILHPGQKLTVLATTGKSHKVIEGETIESIAKKYVVSEEDILDVNDLEYPDEILAEDILVIPLEQVNMPNKPKPTRIVKDESNKVALRQADAPANLAGGILSFMWPTTTRQITQGFHRRHSGLDISNSQMVPVYAACAGFVEISGWQTGYGNTIVINCGSGFKTRYAHLSEIYVSAGDYVEQGQLIAKQGRTGRVRGVTGIHLHFEIIKDGARVNPLSYVRP